MSLKFFSILLLCFYQANGDIINITNERLNAGELRVLHRYVFPYNSVNHVEFSSKLVYS